MKEIISLLVKGAAMGAANVIPGVSGGTVAFITGIYERLINAINSLNVTALKLLFGGRIREFVRAIDFFFLLWLGLGIILSIVSLAKVLQFLFSRHPVFVYAFFFGLILASIYFVGKQVKRWSAGPLIGLAAGAIVAVSVALLTPGRENDSLPYLLLCGVVAMASMIIPGLSGSFVLLLMGNYSLIMIDSVVRLSEGNFDSLRILIPVGIGAVAGLLLLSKLLAWVFRKYHDIAVGLLTGFVAGSLLVIWPWKHEKTVEFQKGDEMKVETVGFDWYLPSFEMQTLIAIALMLGGAILVWVMEKYGTVVEKVEVPESSTSEGS